MLDPLDIGGPVDLGRILRAGDDEAAIGERTGGLDQQPLQGRLPVGAVGAEIGQVPALGRIERRISVRIDRAIKSARRRGAVLAFDPAEVGPPVKDR
jgi:hypothetical protein